MKHVSTKVILLWLIRNLVLLLPLVAAYCIAMESMATPMQKKRGIASYQIHFFPNALTNSVTVHHLDAGLEKSLLGQ